MKAVVYTDGSCVPNPGIGGWGAVILYNGNEIQIHGGDDDTTNNRMELFAIINGIENAMEQGATVIEIVSDSQYCVNTINDWMDWWALNDFYKDGEKRLNHDMIEHIYNLSKKITLKARWVRGHSGDKYNELADDLSNMYRNEYSDKPIYTVQANRFKHSTNAERSKDKDLGLFYYKILERAVGCTAFNRRNFKETEGADKMNIFAEFMGYIISRTYYGCELGDYNVFRTDMIMNEDEIVKYCEPLMKPIMVYVKYLK